VRRRYVLGALGLGVAVVLTVVLTVVRTTARTSSSPAGVVEWPGWGFTHTQYSADVGTGTAVRSVAEALAARPLVQAQSIMGWGADNPEPSPGHYDFTSLDSRMQFIRSSGGIPVLTLCCAPDWMKGGNAGETNWNDLTVAPLPQHFADFAQLAGEIAARYPDVHYFMVWNEFKGFWDPTRNQWDAAGYTDLYNQVYAAVKKANPQAEVGGPYLPMLTADQRADTGTGPPAGPWGALDPRIRAAFEYWLAHQRGADFVVVDGHANAVGPVDPFAALQKFSAVDAWLRDRTHLPVWWAEWYVDPDVAGWPAGEQTAVYTAAMAELARSGAHAVLYWNPPPAGTACATCLWTDTTNGGGGRPLPFLTDVLQNFARWFPPGTKLRSVPAPRGVLVLAQAHAMVVVNTTESRVSTTLDGHAVSLGPHASRWLTGL
jgi:hypothetical protein